MTFREYQNEAVKTALPRALNLEKYLLPNLLSEIGELSGAGAKSHRDEWSYQTLRKEILKEGGDCLWMCAVIAHITDTLDISKEIFPAISRDFTALVLSWASLNTNVTRTNIISMVNRILGYLDDFGISPAEAYAANIAKLADRAERAAIKGSGNDR